MADADEDNIRAPTADPSYADNDLSDETQDFRLLSHLNLYVREDRKIVMSLDKIANLHTF